MATPDAIQASLDTTNLVARIISSNQPNATLTSLFVVGGLTCGSRARWVDVNTADSAATSAAAVLAALRD